MPKIIERKSFSIESLKGEIRFEMVPFLWITEGKN